MPILSLDRLEQITSLEEVVEIFHNPYVFNYLGDSVLFPVLTKSGIHKKASLDILKNLKIKEEK
jgi:hypothetical protein